MIPPGTIGDARSSASGDMPLLVLAVDDDAAITKLLGASLPLVGLATLTASSATEARAMLATRPDIGVVLSDINMPSESGVMLAAEIFKSRLEQEAIEVILMTGRSSSENVSNAVRAQVFAFISKPFRIRALGTTVRAAMERASERRTAAGNRAITDQ